MGPKQCAGALFCLVVASGQYAGAAGGACSYSRNLQQKGVSFSIGSRPAGGCAVQIVSVDARRGNRKLAGFKADVDYLAHSAKAVDLNGDGVPELVVTSRTPGRPDSEALDVYWLNGESVGRATVPELDGSSGSGYRGGDRYRFEGNLLVRTIPVYRDGDADGRPTGGTRSLKYDFRDGAFALYVQTENAANIPDTSTVTNAAPPAPVVPAKEPAPEPAKEKSAAVPGRSVVEVAAGESGIEIRTDGAVAKYRTVRLDKPERIAVDLPGADSKLAGKKIRIDRFGISTVRIGRNKGFLRIVFDTTQAKFPKFEVKSSDAGVRVEFPQ